MASKRILIVDDEPNIVLSLEFLMQREGYQVSTAADGDAALEAVAAEAPDLVILDGGRMSARDMGRAEEVRRRPAALTMFSPLSAILRGPPVTVPLTASVRQALELMERLPAAAIVVADPASRAPLGIFTLRDLLRRVTLPGGDLTQPVACVMTSGLIRRRWRRWSTASLRPPPAPAPPVRQAGAAGGRQSRRPG